MAEPKCRGPRSAYIELKEVVCQHAQRLFSTPELMSVDGSSTEPARCLNIKVAIGKAPAACASNRNLTINRLQSARTLDFSLVLLRLQSCNTIYSVHLCPSQQLYSHWRKICQRKIIWVGPNMGPATHWVLIKKLLDLFHGRSHFRNPQHGQDMSGL